MAVKMSAEEKAVRDALAKLNADSAVSDAAVAAMGNAPATPATPATPVSTTSIFVGTPFGQAPASGYTTTPITNNSNIDFNKASEELTTNKYVASDGTSFTDQAAYATYAAALLNKNSALTASNAAAAQQAAKDQAQKTNWIATAKSLLSSYDLSSLGDKYINLITTGGYDDATAMIKIQSEPEWQARFAGNQTRLKQGLPVLSPAEYLSTEESYKQVMIQAGLSPAVYKDTATLADLIAKDVSPTEVKQRVDAARTVIDNADPYVTLALQQQFGLSKGDMILHVLDPKLASNVIAQKVQATQIAGEAARQGLGVDLQTSADLAAQGITQAQARAGYANIAQDLAGEQALASMYGANGAKVGQNLSAAEFGTAGAAQARTEIENLKQQEIGSFSGSAGASKGTLGVEQTGIL